jgi:ABC-2 type transport system ATP-binding protein
MADEIVIQTRDLRKVFHSKQRGQVAAVAGLDLRVGRGELYGLIGPDGAGKSTTIRLLTGLLRPTDGTAQVLGLGVDGSRNLRRLKARVGYMSQRANLYGDLTVRENLNLFARLQGMGRQARNERIPKLLQFVNLQGVQDRMGSQLSGGMRQKLALTCALVHEPEILFLDEPTLGVDPASRREFWSLLSRLRSDREVTVFVCTPYMDEAERCQRLGLLYQGKVLAEGAPKAIRQRLAVELLDCRPSDLRGAKAVVAGLAGVVEVQTLGDRLRVLVDHASQRLPELAAALADQGITTEGIREAQLGLEEAFIFLVRRQAAAQASRAPASGQPRGKGT